MPLASSLTPESRFMALFVGAKHSGKTAAACSWLRKDTKKLMKVLDADGRIRGILATPWIDRTRIDYDYYPPRVISDKSFFDRVNQDLEALLSQVQNVSCNYETYVLDSATSFCKNLLLDAIPVTHTNSSNKAIGKRIGTMEMAGPADYLFESTGFDSYLSFLRSMPLNVIVSAHLIDKFDKPVKEDGTKDAYAENIVVGEKLSLRDKIGQNSTIYFDHIFKFSRRIVNGKENFFVEYVSDVACTSFLGFKPGLHNITGISFYEYTMDLVKKNQGILA